MKQGPRYRVKPRRRREGKTDYRKRLHLLKSGRSRVVVRKSLKHVRVQFIDYQQGGDAIRASAVSSELVSRYGWKYATATTPAAYLTGLLAGHRAKEKGIKDGVLDLGRHPPVRGGNVFAALKGVLDAGVMVPHDESILPQEERLKGNHLSKDVSSAMKTLKEKISGGK
jgi:large subunit ribosomal protein L18